MVISTDSNFPIQSIRTDPIFKKINLDFFYSNDTGVYFLFQKNILQYVGKSICVSHRIATHAREGKIPFNECFFLPCTIDEYSAIEAFFIRSLKPKFNSIRGLYGRYKVNNP